MNACALHAFPERSGASRWLLSAAVIVGVHAAAVATALAIYVHDQTPGEATPVVMIDLAPVTAAPQASPLDLAPGPTMQEAEAPSAEPELTTQAAVTPEIAPTPVQENAPVPLPPESKPAPQAEADKRAPDKPKRVTPKPQRLAKLHPSEQPPAPRSSAAPNVERRARDAMAAAAGAMAAAVLPSYRQRLAAHLQRFKRYPAEARAAGQQGTATLNFTVGRSGQVLGASLARSSGNAALDAETLAMVRRAEPLPPFPPELNQASLRISVPVSFSVR
ncbi:energy transducer TonB [Rhodopseudomonas sp. AAP120]|uniref:energy transducer TonB family protein n=1 Tax=Rhodopseudomonas sp. AAP120 TaxID=1523430 RepID=UPI0006B9522A|nr:energy transducer TonB [Rhodopseudomonas sp. AAP120]KPF97609.1 energy transducer TonB [Rhodopseudomonas sp. AAP120]